MSAKKTISISLAVVLISTAAFIGCAGTKRVAVVKPQPSCSEAVRSDLQSISDNELVLLLNESQSEGGQDDCWIALVKLGLDNNRDIPRTHLAEAVKIFNQREHEAHFHKAVYRYLADLSKNPSKFRAEDQRLLQAYCSYLINSVQSQQDPNLQQVKLICKRLDQSLYARLFE